MRAGVVNEKIEEIKRVFGVEQTEAALLYLEERRKLTGTIHDYRHEPIVYYMRMDRLVKIGTTRNILMRTSAIMPQGVLAVEWGGLRLERQRHAEFDDCHSHLEWYWMRDRLWAHISRLREAAPAALGLGVDDWLRKHGVGAREPGPAGEVGE